MAYLKSHPSLQKSGPNLSKSIWYQSVLHKFLPGSISDRILEIGPGRGEGLSFLANAGYQIDAIDIDEDVVRICSAVEGASVHHVKSITSYAQGCTTKYSLVYMFHVLEHIKRDEIVPTLNSIFDILDINGRLLIVVPNVSSPIVGVDQQFFDFTHETAFSPSSLQQALMMSKFTDIQLTNLWPETTSPKKYLQKSMQIAFSRSLELIMRVFYGTRRDVISHQILAVARKGTSKSVLDD